MDSEPESRQRASPLLWTVLFVALVMCASTFGINSYRYGIADQLSLVPLVKRFADPGLYVSDYLFQKGPAYYTVVAGAGALVRLTGVSVPALFFICYLAALFLTFLAVYLIAMELFGRMDVACLALFLFVFRIQVPGGVPTFDELFTTRLAALPLLLFGMLRLSERPAGVVGAARLGNRLHHPSSVRSVRRRDSALRAAGESQVAGLAAGGCRRWNAARRDGSVPYPGVCCVERMLSRPCGRPGVGPEVMRLRSSQLVFASSWNAETWLCGLLLIVAFVIARRHRPKVAEHHRFVICCALTVAALGIAGIVFAEFIPLGVNGIARASVPEFEVLCLLHDSLRGQLLGR